MVTVQTGSEEQQREQLLGQGDSGKSEGVPTLRLCGLVCSSRRLSHEAPEVMSLGEEAGPVNDFDRLEVQSWKVSRKRSAQSVQQTLQTQGRTREAPGRPRS